MRLIVVTYLLFLLKMSTVYAEFNADILNQDISVMSRSAGETSYTTYELSNITNGMPTHLKMHFRCNVRGSNAGAYNHLRFLDSNGAELLLIVGCDFAGVSDGNSGESNGTRIIPIPSNSSSFEMRSSIGPYAISDPNTQSRISVDVLGDLTPSTANRIVVDDFKRNHSEGWGIAPNGSTWVISGDIANYQVNNGSGDMLVNSLGNSRKVSINQSSLNTELLSSINLDAEANTGYIFGGLALRMNDAKTDYYYARLRNSNGFLNITLIRVADNSNFIIESKTTLIPFHRDEFYSLRFMALGANPTTLFAKAWPEEQSEPTGWDLKYYDRDSRLQEEGFVGARSGVGSGFNGDAIVSYKYIFASSLN